MAAKTLIQMKAEYVRLREVIGDPRFDDLKRKERTGALAGVLFLQRSDGPGFGPQEIGIEVNQMGERVLKGSLRIEGESS